ncbi:MAG: hypothetical protein AB7H97_19645, partial [Pseudobdellovibrionaceae bacterium]
VERKSPMFFTVLTDTRVGRNQMPTKSTTLGFVIESNPGAFVQPKSFHFLKDSKEAGVKPSQPFPYLTDLLCALPAHRLFKELSEIKTPEYPEWLENAWEFLDSHLALYQRAEKRARSFRPKKAFVDENSQRLCKSFREIVESCFSGGKFNFDPLSSLAESITFLEKKLGEPLVYNFKFSLPDSDRALLFALYSFLYYQRALVALDFNSQVKDSAFECVKVDPINDYIPRADYTVNDALLYKELHKLVEKLPDTQNHMDALFREYAHNAYYLANAIPTAFSGKLRRDECEESLYSIQMDWLLGADSGLLFRLREEVYALSEGYEKIFWTDYSHQSESTQSHLEVCTKVDHEWLKRALPKIA